MATSNFDVKVVPGTSIVVDGFRNIPRGKAGEQFKTFFLTHFHADHYAGIKKGWKKGTIYCSRATANLLELKFGLRDCVQPLDMNVEYDIDGVRVTLLDANHCPGSVLLLFELDSGDVYLHTGDFRFCREMLDYTALKPFIPVGSSVPQESSASGSAEEDTKPRLASSSPSTPLKATFTPPKLQTPSPSSSSNNVATPSSSPKKPLVTMEDLAKIDFFGDEESQESQIIEEEDDDSQRFAQQYEFFHKYQEQKKNPTPTKQETKSPVKKQEGEDNAVTDSNNSDEEQIFYPPSEDPTQKRVKALFLDTTYCNPDYNFPKQIEAINIIADIVALQMQNRQKKTLFLIGSYQIGKERVIEKLIQSMNCKVFVTLDKYQALQCLDLSYFDHITTNPAQSDIHMVPMFDVSWKKLFEIRKVNQNRYDHIFAFKPSGWSFAAASTKMTPSSTTSSAVYYDVSATTKSNITLIEVPYSEHSSFSELKEFVSTLKPLKVVPTVYSSESQKRSILNLLSDKYKHHSPEMKLSIPSTLMSTMQNEPAATKQKNKGSKKEAVAPSGTQTIIQMFSKAKTGIMNFFKKPQTPSSTPVTPASSSSSPKPSSSSSSSSSSPAPASFKVASSPPKPASQAISPTNSQPSTSSQLSSQTFSQSSVTTAPSSQQSAIHTSPKLVLKKKKLISTNGSTSTLQQMSPSSMASVANDIPVTVSTTYSTSVTASAEIIDITADEEDDVGINFNTGSEQNPLTITDSPTKIKPIVRNTEDGKTYTGAKLVLKRKRTEETKTNEKTAKKQKCTQRNTLDSFLDKKRP